MSKKDKSLLVPEKKDAFSRILRFMTKSDITLRSDEEVILDRWVYCDTLLRKGTLTTDDVVADMVQRWAVSKFTALNDINYTQRLFERSRQLSKKYLMHHHLERINADLERVRKAFFYKEGEDGLEERRIDEKEATAVAKMHDTYTRAIEALPDEQVADKLPPPMFIYNIAPGQQLQLTMSIEDAMAAADEILDMKENGEGVYELEQ